MLPAASAAPITTLGVVFGHAEMLRVHTQAAHLWNTTRALPHWDHPSYTGCPLSRTSLGWRALKECRYPGKPQAHMAHFSAVLLHAVQGFGQGGVGSSSPRACPNPTSCAFVCSQAPVRCITWLCSVPLMQDRSGPCMSPINSPFVCCECTPRCFPTPRERWVFLPNCVAVAATHACTWAVPNVCQEALHSELPQACREGRLITNCPFEFLSVTQKCLGRMHTESVCV